MADSEVRPDWAPDNVETNVASVARMYDYLLGGRHNFAVDRTAAKELLEVEPGMRDLARLNRALLRWSVAVMAEGGVRQFLDLGSGIPTTPSVHEVAQGIAADSSVVYVDVDPVAIAHARMVLRDVPRTAILTADLHDPAAVLKAAVGTGLLDLSRPVGVILFAVLHYINDTDEANALVGAIKDAMAPGSFLALGQLAQDGNDAPAVAVSDSVAASTHAPLRPRTLQEVLGFFDGLDLVEPGLIPIGTALPLVAVPSFDPVKAGLAPGVPTGGEGAAERAIGAVGVARKP